MKNNLGLNTQDQKRPGVIEGQGSRTELIGNEQDRGNIDGPLKGVQTARSLKPSKPEDVHRISISKEADEALVKFVERVNDGFDGRISRVNAANWILIRSIESLSDSVVREIRAEHFDEVAALEALYMRARKGGGISPELKALLQKQVGLDDAPKKRKKQLQDNIINDDIAS